MISITHEVWIDAPRASVYKLLGSAEGVSQWWDQQTEVATADAVYWDHTPGPEHGTVRMQVLQRVDGRLIEWKCISQHKSDTPASAWTGTRLRFQLFERDEIAIANQAWSKAVPAQTVLVFEQSEWDETNPYFAFCNFAWGSVLQNLANAATQAASEGKEST